MYSILHIADAFYVYSRGKSLPNGRKWARFDTAEKAHAYRKGLR
jgi:hypothetical protein